MSFKKKTRFTKITPGLNDNNILLDKSINLDFIEKNIKFNNILKSFFGGDYTIDSKWLIKVLRVYFFVRLLHIVISWNPSSFGYLNF